MDILTVDYNDRHAGDKFVTSLHKTGFAVIKNHPINYALVQKIFSEWREFFATEQKFNYPYDKKRGDGYVGTSLSETAKGSDNPDVKEFYQIYRPWGRYPTELAETTLLYFDQIYKLAHHLLTWIDKFTPTIIHMGFSEPLVKMASLEQTMLRILHYPPFSGQEQANQVRAAAHEDINLITLLPASNAMGLQVKTKKNTWLDVGTNEGEIIINVGDMLQECSNGYYVSTTHRVVNPGSNNTSRYSMPLFVHPRADVHLSDKYKRAEHYLHERLAELGLRE